MLRTWEHCFHISENCPGYETYQQQADTQQGVDYYIAYKLETAYLIEHNSIKLSKGITCRLKIIESVVVRQLDISE
jgi:hypothetical protein